MIDWNARFNSPWEKRASPLIAGVESSHGEGVQYLRADGSSSRPRHGIGGGCVEEDEEEAKRWNGTTRKTKIEGSWQVYTLQRDFDSASQSKEPTSDE